MREKKDIKVQIRITATEKQMIDKLKEHEDFSISKFFRKKLHGYFKEQKIEENGIGTFRIG